MSRLQPEAVNQPTRR